ncbi:MAG: DUF4386 domain-containing protein [Anaerolineales bacterium]|nr:DUF4386 domain-containing protein [Anaerolineales bacterium]
MTPHERSARLVGILFIVGTVAGVLSGVLSAPVLGAADFPANITRDADQLILGGLLVLVMGLALAMIPALLFPVFRPYGEVLALGAVIFRGVLEAVAYSGIALCWFLLVTLGQVYGRGSAVAAPTLQLLAALAQEATNWINLVLGVVFSLGALMVYWLFYRSRLIPRWLAGWGFLGGLLYLAAHLVTMFDPLRPPLSLETGIGVLMTPLAIQEMVLAFWLIVKGFHPAAPAPAGFSLATLVREDH